MPVPRDSASPSGSFPPIFRSALVNLAPEFAVPDLVEVNLADPLLFPEGLNLPLYGRSPWRVGDLDGSTTPAAALTLSATNPTDAPLELSLLLTLPLSVQNDVARFGSPAAAAASSAVGGAMSAAECVEACAGDDGCDDRQPRGLRLGVAVGGRLLVLLDGVCRDSCALEKGKRGSNVDGRVLEQRLGLQNLNEIGVRRRRGERRSDPVSYTHLTLPTKA